MHGQKTAVEHQCVPVSARRLDFTIVREDDIGFEAIQRIWRKGAANAWVHATRLRMANDELCFSPDGRVPRGEVFFNP